jgi:uncharacterized protein YgiM (DUF1202 family)
VRSALAVIALLGAFALPAYAAQFGTMTRPGDLKSTPLSDAKTLQALTTGTRLEVLKRNGGWYEVKTATGAKGWVRMWLLRFSAETTGAGALKQNVAVLQSGRSTSTYTTATTGVRGLSEEDLKNAKPNPQAVAALEQLAVTQDDARGFARKGKLKADPAVLKDVQ